MVDGIKVEVKGIKELQAKFKLISKDIEDIAAQAVGEGGQVVKTAAKGKVHVITGNLQRSIDVLRTEKSENKVQVSVGSTVPYAEPEEFRVGGKYPGPHSYLRWALDNNETQVVSTIKASIESRLKRYS